MKTLILLGGGGHAAVVAETARAAGYVVEGYLDDAAPAGETESPVVGFKHLGAIASVPEVKSTHRHANFHAAIGDAQLRRQWLGLVSPRPTPAIIHPSAVVSPSARIGEGVYIGANAVVNARVIVADGVISNTGAIIEHDCVLEAFCHIAPGSVLAGGVLVGEAAMIGAGARVIPGVRIGARATLGAGAVAISDIPENTTAIGVPARVLSGG